jgi:hypothetical protein
MPSNQGSIQQNIAPDNRGSVTSNDASLQGYDYRHSANCLDSVSESLPSDEWIAAAAQACHPGSQKLGATISKVSDGDGQFGFEIPIGPKQRCWTAFAVVDQNLLPTQVGIVEKDGLFHPLGVLSTSRSVVPKSGPFCALQGDFNSVRLRSIRGSVGNASLTFYSFDG